MRKDISSALVTLLLFASLLTVLPASVTADMTVSPGSDIGYAIANVEDGGTIYFQPGTYDNCHIFINGASLQKSFSLVSIAGPETTILDGGSTGPVITITNTDTTSFGTYEITIDGFTITNGMMSSVATGSIATTVSSISEGGGMHISYSLVTITNCIFTKNTAYAKATNNTASASAEARGGGVYIGWSIVSITNCIFTENMAQSLAEASGAGDANAVSSGAAMYLRESSPIIVNCTIAYNSLMASAARDIDGTGSLFTDIFGSGIYNSKSSPIITNCIIWNSIHNATGSTPIVTYSNISSIIPGIGNIYVDPLFVDAPADVSLSADSPCIDTGTNTSGPAFGGVTDDILGIARPQGTAYDMGAYEYRQSMPASPWSPVSIMPLVRTQLDNTLVAWNELSAQLPSEPTDEMTSLIERIQEHMGNATGLANPIYASGELAKANTLMGELSQLL
ncbi:hypothetical protein EF808_02660 [archaeon]|nr:MAG: hypothetical protein EF808_02660 [archaeon]